MKKILFSLLMLCSMTAAWAEGSGDGSKDHPFTGEWQVADLTELKKGDHIAYDCVIMGSSITIYDTELEEIVAHMWFAWAPGNFIGENPLDAYADYCYWYKQVDDRKTHTFIVDDVSRSPTDHNIIGIDGHFSEFYGSPDASGFIRVASAKQMEMVLGRSDSAKVQLMQDIYMSDLGEGESGRHVLCSTFKGILDGDGHTIWAARPEVQHDGGGHYHRQYLFTYSDGATVKNLTFKNFRVQSEDHHNQAVITSQAKNHCVFENITLDHVSLWCKKDNVGAATGYATDNCIFKNITVKNSDLTADNKQSGGVVGHAMNCEFTNIKVEHCESTARNGKAGGVVGRTDNCKFNDVEILGSFIKMSEHTIIVGDERDAGGVAGYAENSQFTNCTADDQSCINGDESTEEDGPADVGGIVGCAMNCNVRNCINSALVAACGHYAGGIVGYSEHTNIEECVNTGMVICIKMSKVADLYNKYKTKTSLPCVTKTYQGKEYVIRKYEDEKSYEYRENYGGIAGVISKGNVSKSVNFGSLYIHYYDYSKNSWIIGGITSKILGENSNITDCLCDFSGAKGVFAFCRSLGEGSSIKNCLNMTTYEDTDKRYCELGSASHIYSLSTGDVADFVTKTTTAEVKTGKICYLLGEAWEQNIGTDAYPTPTGSKKGVYHTRTVSNQYGTVCLPYYLKPDDKISYYCIDENRLRDDLTTLKFKYIEEVRPGLPVLFRVKDFNGTPQELIFNCEYGDLGFANAPYGWDGGYNFWGMGGTFEEKVFTETTEIPSNEVYYLSNGEIRNAKKVTIPAFRGFLYRPDLEKLGILAKSFQIEIEDEDGTTTSITPAELDSLPRESWGGVSFTLMGTKAPANYRGIVIKNGKKIFQNR